MQIEEDFEQLLADEQHQQLISVLKELTLYTKTEQDSNNKVSQAIIQYNKNLSLLLSTVEKLLIKPQSNQDLVNSINSLRENQLKIINLLSIKPTRLKPSRTFDGEIEYVDIEWQDISK
jgi:FtsZ-interacting cell division protein YlmF